MLKEMKKIALIISIILFNSCSSTFYCYLNSMGSSPQDKTYFITSNNASLNKSIEYKEYFRDLKIILDDLGYIQADSVNAALKVVFDYRIGEQQVYKTNVQVVETVTTFVPTAPNTTLWSGTFSFGSAPATTKRSYVPISSDEEDINLPVYVDICAFDNKTDIPIWKVTVWDEVERETQISSVIPYLLACAKDYFGMNSRGEQMVEIDRFEAEKKYGFVWPY